MKLKRQLRMLIAMVCIGFIIVGLFALWGVTRLKADGPIYTQIGLGKDFMADVLPPPQNILETHLLAFGLRYSADTVQITALKEQIGQLQNEYQSRHEYWKKAGLTQALQQPFLEEAHGAAQRYFDKLNADYLPAAQAADHKRMDSLLAELNAIYAEHQKSISTSVELAKKQSAELDRQASGMGSTIVMVGALVFLLAVGTVLFFAHRITSGLLASLGGDPEQATSFANRLAAGDLDLKIPLEKDDKASLFASIQRVMETLKQYYAAQIEMKRQHDAGFISFRIDVAKFAGGYHEMAEMTNELVAAHIAVKMQVVDVVSRYAIGDLSVEMERLPGEKAKITEAVDSVRDSLRNINDEIARLVEAAAHGNFKLRGDVEKYQYDFRRMIEGLNRLMQVSDSGLNEVARVLAALAQGDLTEKITNEYAGTFGQLKDDSNETVEKLTDIVRQLKDATESINTAAKEIASGNSDLSQRTEQQASSLEETASSMEELTSTVQQNAENARQANQLAIGASDVAVKGGAVVNQVVDTMSSINASSKKIVDIISVIDGIAFQTNILALNAAVEAARAGEQGRGFAVVATEVRNLAQRSAAAAKEIKTLIGDSVEKVSTGTKLVDEAGKTMEEIVSSVKRVTDIMSEIMAASQEQSSGIEQVNQAIGQMDEVTQQNAALVEQAAAAAESLEEQAHHLADAVSIFKLGGGLEVVAPKRAAVNRLPAKLASEQKVAVAEPKRAAPRKSAKPTATAEDEWEEF